MPFHVKVQPVQRVSEYNGSGANGDYCIATWKVRNVSENTIMLVSCFSDDDEKLSANPTLAMDAELTIICRDWNKDGRSGSMNNVTLRNVIAPAALEVVQQAVQPQQSVVGQGFNNAGSFPPVGDLPF